MHLWITDSHLQKSSSAEIIWFAWGICIVILAKLCCVISRWKLFQPDSYENTWLTLLLGKLLTSFAQVPMHEFGSHTVKSPGKSSMLLHYITPPANMAVNLALPRFLCLNMDLNRFHLWENRLCCCINYQNRHGCLDGFTILAPSVFLCS